MPGTFVLMGLNSPRTSAGAFGLRSYMSMCDGPPACQMRMTDFFGAAGCAARSRSRLGRVRPPTARAPTWRNDRREETVSMDILEGALAAQSGLIILDLRPEFTLQLGNYFIR